MNRNITYLYDIDDNIIKKIPICDAMLEIYHLKYRIPTDKELKTQKIKRNQQKIQKEISSDDTFTPLYDAFTYNIYLIQKRNVYIRIMRHDYRFPDCLILDSVKKGLEKKRLKLNKNPELKNDKIFMRSIRKATYMINFMDQFDQKILYNTYLNTFIKYAPEIGNATFTCIRKSFIPHMSHIKPYYTRDEIIKLGMNMGFIEIPENMEYIDYKDRLSHDEYNNICSKIQENDISADILIEHQNYIIRAGMVGLVQYYTIQGSYFMNQYLRNMTKYEYRNDYLEENIKKIWNLIHGAPQFDREYILYRFVSSDDYLRHLNVGDIYIEKGFTSTTRDPFYRNDTYKFGFILIKIRIPKHKSGIALCLETLSHFPYEEEIILPPLVHLKLISKNESCNYYHPDEEFASHVQTRYEFLWINNDDIKFQTRPDCPKETQLIDFLTIEKIKSISTREKTYIMVKKYFDPMNRIKCKIGKHIFYVVAEWYDSTGPYADMYALKTSDGFSLYSIYDGYILFMIEIGEIDGIGQIRVNYYTKYSQLSRQKIMGDDNFIHFISSVSYYFDIPNIVIYADYLSCDQIKDIKCNNISSGFDGIIGSNDDNIDNELMGGSYCVDFYLYLKYCKKRYENTSTLNVELQPLFSYHDLDHLKSVSPSKVLEKEDRDEVYQIYEKNYKLDVSSGKDNLADFYIWMIENKCYLMDIFVTKIDRIYRKNNPFHKGMYILDAMSYLYNRRYVSVYNRYIKMVFNEEHVILNLPKNEYRIVR